jgi:hypothetical protein
MRLRHGHLRNICAAAGMLLACATSSLADISRFVGEYVGTAEVIEADGTSVPRDMSVKISEQKNGFQVDWSSTTFRGDGRVSEKSYSVNFVPSERDGVFSAAMQRNVFGHAVQLDPMKGEPFVWARIDQDTLSVYSLYVAANGGYEIQQFDRTLADGGLDLQFSRVRNGEIQRTVRSFLERQ